MKSGDAITIGRHHENSIVLNDTSISRRHAQVIFERNTLRVEDLRSGNGTFLNEQRIEDTKWQEGQVLRIGTVNFTLTSKPNQHPFNLPKRHSSKTNEFIEPSLADPHYKSQNQHISFAPNQRGKLRDQDNLYITNFHAKPKPLTSEHVDRSDSAKSQIFLSYSRQDNEHADWFSRQLEKRGIRVFRDVDDTLPSEEWWARLQSLIINADTVLFLLSPHSAESNVCRDEVEFARSLNKRIFPVVIADVNWTAVPEGLAKLHATFFLESDSYEKSFQILINALLTDIEWVREHTVLLERAQTWKQKQRPKAELLSGSRLAEAESWLASQPGQGTPPTALHNEFIQASRKQATRRQRSIIVMSSVIATAAMSLAGVAYYQRQIAIRERDDALVTQSRFLANRAQSVLERGDAQAAMLLSLAALPDTNRQRPYVPAAEVALIRSISRNRMQSTAFCNQNGENEEARRSIRSLSPNSNGSHIIAHYTRTYKLLGLERGDGGRACVLSRDGHIVASFGSKKSWVQNSWFHPAGRRILVHFDDKTLAEFTYDGMLIKQFKGKYNYARYSPSGNVLIAPEAGPAILQTSTRQTVFSKGTVGAYYASPVGKATFFFYTPRGSIFVNRKGKTLSRISFRLSSQDPVLSLYPHNLVVQHQQNVESFVLSSGRSRAESLSPSSEGISANYGSSASADGLRTVSFDSHGIFLTDGDHRTMKRVLKRDDGSIKFATFAGTSKFIVVSDTSGHLFVLDIKGQVLARIGRTRRPARAAWMSKDAKRLVTADNEGQITYWNINGISDAGNVKLEAVTSINTGTIRRIISQKGLLNPTRSPQPSWVRLAPERENLTVVFESGAKVTRLDRAFIFRGPETVVATHKDGFILVFDKIGKEKFRAKASSVVSVSMSKTGETLLLGLPNRLVQVDISSARRKTLSLGWIAEAMGLQDDGFPYIRHIRSELALVCFANSIFLVNFNVDRAIAPILNLGKPWDSDLCARHSLFNAMTDFAPQRDFVGADNLASPEVSDWMRLAKRELISCNDPETYRSAFLDTSPREWCARR